MFDEGFSYMNSFAKVSPGPSAGVQEADEIRGPGSDLLQVQPHQDRGHRRAQVVLNQRVSTNPKNIYMQADHRMPLQRVQVLSPETLQFNIDRSRYDEAASLRTDNAPGPSFAAVRRDKCRVEVTR